MFTNERGGYLHRQTVCRIFKDIAASVGAVDVHFHTLRHTYAITALQAGDNVKTVQQNLGHHTAAFTLDTYGHVTEDMQKDSAAKMETFAKLVFNL